MRFNCFQNWNLATGAAILSESNLNRYRMPICHQNLKGVGKTFCKVSSWLKLKGLSNFIWSYLTCLRKQATAKLRRHKSWPFCFLLPSWVSFKAMSMYILLWTIFQTAYVQYTFNSDKQAGGLTKLHKQIYIPYGLAFPSQWNLIH